MSLCPPSPSTCTESRSAYEVCKAWEKVLTFLKFIAIAFVRSLVLQIGLAQ